MIFRDDWERKAHDIICVIKHGTAGGNVQQRDIERVADILRGHSLKPVLGFPKVVLAPTLPENTALVIPKINGLPTLTGHDPTKTIGKVELPNVTISAPGFIATIKLP